MPPAELQLWQRLAILAAFGAAGTISRYFVHLIIQRLQGTQFPWGTFAVNALGCLAFGIVWGLAEHRAMVGPQTRLFLLVGFMGAFTTFSSYAFETAQLLESGRWLWAGGNLLLQNIVGISLVLAGIALGKLF
jgi:CrcB protein